MRVVIDGDVRLFVDIAGSHLSPDPEEMRERPVLLVLHGGPGGDHSLGRPYFDRFCDTHCVIYFDHRGHGRSDQWDDRSGWELDTWADDVQRLCEALELRSPVLLGNSFGGTVAAHAAGRHHGLASKLVLMSTFVRHDLDAVLTAFDRRGGSSARAVAERFWTSPSDEALSEYNEVCLPLYTLGAPMSPPGRALANLATVLHYVKHIAPGLDVTSSVAAIECPTLVLVGEDDPICPPVMSELIVSLLPAERARFVRFAACGHGTFRDQPVRTEHVVRDFLSVGSTS
jgi:proline iminopeptidase